MSEARDGGGIGPLYGAGAYVMWGLLPLFFKTLTGVPALQILSHRVLWSLLLVGAIVLIFGRWRGIVAALRVRWTLPMLALSALLIASNWLVYIWAVLHDHMLEASLGYFINPLVNVLVGVVVLGERLRRWQAIAVALAAVGVAVMLFSDVSRIWVPLALAGTFAGYGLIRKLAPIDALGGLTVETIVLAPAALAVVLWAAHHGYGAFGQHRATDGLLMLAGALTAVPLLLFAGAAKRMRFTTLGLLQYIAPTLQFLLAVLVYGEPFRPIHMLTFGCIWAGCALYAADSVRAAREKPVDLLPA